jgi:hypothetical protein
VFLEADEVEMGAELEGHSFSIVTSGPSILGKPQNPMGFMESGQDLAKPAPRPFSCSCLSNRRIFRSTYLQCLGSTNSVARSHCGKILSAFNLPSGLKSI